MSPNRPIPDEATRVRIVSGIELEGKDEGRADDCMSAINSEVADVGSTFPQFENCDAVSADNMSLTSDDGILD